MPIARFKDLCLDAVDSDRLEHFWAGALAYEVVQVLADPEGNEFCVFVEP